ncbi:hypothetical protein K438DRAFT_2023480 [Mycena galopus ATCC 62051]|nr:hypothetical protein K438DRAFT_2023480 [Mycena galopus ATCC 62051]
MRQLAITLDGGEHVRDRHHGCYFSRHWKSNRQSEVYGEHGISISLPVGIRLYRRPFQCDVLIGLFRVYTLAARSILVGNRPALRSAPAPRHPTYALSAHVALRSRFPRLLHSFHIPSLGPTSPALHNAASAMPLPRSQGIALKASAGEGVPVQGLRRMQPGLQPQKYAGERPFTRRQGHAQREHDARAHNAACEHGRRPRVSSTTATGAVGSGGAKGKKAKAAAAAGAEGGDAHASSASPTGSDDAKKAALMKRPTTKRARPSAVKREPAKSSLGVRPGTSPGYEGAVDYAQEERDGNVDMQDVCLVSFFLARIGFEFAIARMATLVLPTQHRSPPLGAPVATRAAVLFGTRSFKRKEDFAEERECYDTGNFVLLAMLLAESSILSPPLFLASFFALFTPRTRRFPFWAAWPLEMFSSFLIVFSATEYRCRVMRPA